FALFALPFRFGGAWDAKREQARANGIVLDDATNELFFGGTNSVGRTLEIDGRAFLVLGVLAPMPRRLRAYDFSFTPAPALYLPFSLYETLFARPDYLVPRAPHGPSMGELIASDDQWIHLWVELPNAERRARYERDLASAVGPGRAAPKLRSSAEFI